MDDSLIYRKTRLGATELAAATHGALSPAARRVLILLDGRRPIGELSELFGQQEVEKVIFDLVAQGFAREVDPQGDTPTTTTVDVPLTVPGAAHMASPAPARGRPVWLTALVAVVSAAAVGAGAWYGTRGDRIVGSVATADAAPAVADRAGTVELASATETTATDASAGARELPLSGLPPVTVSLNSPGAARGRKPAAAVDATEEPAATPEAVVDQEPAPAPPPRVQAQPTPRPAARTPTAAAEPRSVQTASTPTAAEPRNVAAAAATTTAEAQRAPPAVTPPAPALAVAPRPAIVPVATVDTAEGTKLASTIAAGERRSDAGASSVGVAPPATPLSAPSDGTGAKAGQNEQLASLAPPPRPQSAPVQLHPRRHDAPEFPARAMRARVFEGHVLARISVNAEGKVDRVDIVKATPARIFDDEVKRTLSNWTFDPPGRPTDTTVEFDFKP